MNVLGEQLLAEVGPPPPQVQGLMGADHRMMEIGMEKKSMAENYVQEKLPLETIAPKSRMVCEEAQILA